VALPICFGLNFAAATFRKGSRALPTLLSPQISIFTTHETFGQLCTAIVLDV